MKAFEYHRVTTLDEALELAVIPGHQIIAGGMDLIPLMSDDLAAPTSLIDISRIPELGTIHYEPGVGLRLGTLASLSRIMTDAAIQRYYPVLTRAIAESASPQIRNMATIGGNLLQQPRCGYYRDREFACLRRDGGTTCSALLGDHERHAIFQTPDPADPHHCVAVNPSDAVNALLAIDAAVVARSTTGERIIPLADFFADPTKVSTTQSTLSPGEMITAIVAPPPPANVRGQYIKIRDRASYAFAIVSAAAVIAMDGALVAHARCVLGGVAWRPWRVPAAEAVLVGQPLTADNVAAAARAALADAHPLPENGFKIPMAEAALRRAITTAAALD